MRRQTADWEETLEKYVADKGLVSRIYEALFQLNTIRNNPVKVGQKPEW